MNKRQQSRVIMDARLDQEWAELREVALEHDPFVLLELFLKLDPDRALEGLDERDRPMVAALAQMAIKQIFSLCSADPEEAP